MGVAISVRPLRRLAPLALGGVSLLVLSAQAKAEDFMVEFKPVPVITSAYGDFSFKVRGRVETDFILFDSGKNTPDLSSGSDVRRARLGVEGTMYGDWDYRLEFDFAQNEVEMKDVLVTYKGFKAMDITAGNQKTPNSLERLTSSSNLTFLERAMAVEAFTHGANAGGDWKLGLSAAHVEQHWTLSGGVFGESVDLTSAEGGDEGYGFNGRVTVAPVNAEGRLLHFGVSAYWRDAGGRNFVRFGDRPEVRVDGTRAIDTSTLDAKTYTFIGGEFVGAIGSAFVHSEYLRTDVNRLDPANPDLSFDGYYVTAGYFLTGESLPYTDGGIGSLKPRSTFTSHGGTGAFQIAARYSTIDLNDRDIQGGNAKTYTVGLNWWANPYIRVLLDWVHFESKRQDNELNGNAFGTRLAVRW